MAKIRSSNWSAASDCSALTYCHALAMASAVRASAALPAAIRKQCKRSLPQRRAPSLIFSFWRQKGECANCKKARAEEVAFLSQERPHLTQDYAWWIGRICKIAAVSRVAELLQQDETTTWRLDFARMKRMLAYYQIPNVTKVSVDEVYARKKPKYEGESRDERTVWEGTESWR